MVPEKTVKCPPLSRKHPKILIFTMHYVRQVSGEMFRHETVSEYFASKTFDVLKVTVAKTGVFAIGGNQRLLAHKFLLSYIEPGEFYQTKILLGRDFWCQNHTTA